MSLPPRRKLVRAGAWGLVVYLAGFLVLWLGGGYVLCESGKTRVWTGMPLPDVAEWQPLFGWCQPEYQWPGVNSDWSGGDTRPRCDAIGWLYYPLWLAVKARHPALTLRDASGRCSESFAIHPAFRSHPFKGKGLVNNFSITGDDAGKRLVLKP